MKPIPKYMRIIAIDPSSKGFGFAVLEGGDRLIDWGVARVWAKSDKEFLARIEDLIRFYRPVLVVIEETGDRRRSARWIKRSDLITKYANGIGIRIVGVGQSAKREAFRRRTKHEIATAIAGVFPELKPHLPPRRKPWMCEDERMNLFDAVALALIGRFGELDFDTA